MDTATSENAISCEGVDTAGSGKSSTTVTGQSDNISAAHRQHHSRHLSSRHVRQNTFQLLSTCVNEEDEGATGSNLNNACPVPRLPMREVVLDRMEGLMDASSSHARKVSDVTVDTVLDDDFLLQQLLGRRFGQHRHAGGDDSRSTLGFRDSDIAAIIRKNYGINDILSLHARNDPRRAPVPQTVTAPTPYESQIRDRDRIVSPKSIPIHSVKATTAYSGNVAAGESTPNNDPATLLGLDILNDSASSFDYGEGRIMPVAENAHDAYILLGGIKDSISILDESKYPFRQGGETFLESSFRSDEDDTRFFNMVNANRNSSTYLALGGIKDSISILDQSKYPSTRDEDSCLETSFRSIDADTRFFDMVNANRNSSTYLALGGIKDSISILDQSEHPFGHESKSNFSNSLGSEGDESGFCAMMNSIALGRDSTNENGLSSSIVFDQGHSDCILASMADEVIETKASSANRMNTEGGNKEHPNNKDPPFIPPRSQNGRMGIMFGNRSCKRRGYGDEGNQS